MEAKPSVNEGCRFTAAVIYPGPIPPSGGPLRDRYLETKGRESLRAADAFFGEAMDALGKHVDEAPTIYALFQTEDDALRDEVQKQKRLEWHEFSQTVHQRTLNAVEPKIRRSEAEAVAALNYLEDHELVEAAHIAIHHAAFVRRGLYGCSVVLRDGELWTDCSIRISHLRVGMSAELVSESECSICRLKVEDCDHNINQFYKIFASRDMHGKCSICEKTACEHEAGRIYPAVARGIVRSMHAEAVSIVSRPRYPLARMTERSIDFGEENGQSLYRDAARHDMLHCDACLGPCNGFSELPEELT